MTSYGATVSTKDDVLFVSHSSLTWKSSQRRFRVDRPFVECYWYFKGLNLKLETYVT